MQDRVKILSPKFSGNPGTCEMQVLFSRIEQADSPYRCVLFYFIYYTHPLGGGIKRWCASDVCLTSVCRVHRA